ncbi:helix-turn-helix domain-containing protein [Pontibacillus yanchengensis]|uniref:Helix-turn-helix domain-containing protein n=2 Tax=Pontibacillus yanchengensis TaxID=462910 RepID=A0ACC7VLE3_9BACI|nr:helix-turn-helix domain-containing protein [Pontibacillus yanchengensis]MYL32609.1 helix-turn-helix domain-containing protein [Pontibacillus yanchengensis]MYL55004.1 helix-turn-helix domain-containing protein [Pontibacillus yanchengensis]
MEMKLDLEHTGVLLFDLQTGEADETHTHDHFQLSVPMSGNLLTYHNHKEQKLESDQSLLVPPGDIHQHEAYQDQKRIMLISFNEEIVKNVYETKTGDKLHSIDFSPIQHVSTNLVNKAKSIIQSASFQGVEEAMTLEEEFTSAILDYTMGSHSQGWHRNPQLNHTNEPYIVNLLIEFIHDQYHDQLSLEVMAMHMNMSKYHLHRTFTKHMGVTPVNYLHQIRLKKVVSLLLQSRYDITQAAFEVGYRSISTFNRTFKNFYQQTPSQYVKEHRF